MSRETPYDEEGRCSWCGGSCYWGRPYQGRYESLVCEDCGKTVDGPDWDLLLQDKLEDRRLLEEDSGYGSDC